MSAWPPTSRTVTLGQVKDGFASVIDEVAANAERLVVEEGGVPRVAVVSMDDYRRLTRMDDEDREAWRIVAAMREPFRDVPPTEIARKAKRTVAEDRARRRAERRLADEDG